MKKFLKFIRRAASNFWVRLVFFLCCIAIIFAVSGAFVSWATAGEKMLELITSGDVLSIFLVAAVSLIIADVIIKGKRVLEESDKIEDDHHKIVCKYGGHKKHARDFSKNLYKKSGELMYLRTVPSAEKRRYAKNPVKDTLDDAHASREQDICDYVEKGELNLPSVAVFTNVLGDVKVKFDDKPERFELPAFVKDNVLKLMEAHKGSKVSNSVTIRLNDIDYADGTLTLKTSRSQYFDMLVTNRCMDYHPDDSMSVRDVFEFGSTVTPLEDSKLGNQIGINGLILTRDGYLLVEKRGRKKTTWKDKFAQPISLAMKLKDARLAAGESFGADTSVPESVFKNIVLGTIGKNFGLTERDITGFSMADNFMGIARDLLEGGKPNMYFYVTVNMDSDAFVEFLENKCQKACVKAVEQENAERARRKAGKPADGDGDDGGEKLPKLTWDKLDSDYYLIDYADIKIDYDYVLGVDTEKLKSVRRKYNYNDSKRALAGGKVKRKRPRGKTLKKECGEAFLACLYFADACSERIDRQLDKSARLRYEETV